MKKILCLILLAVFTEVTWSAEKTNFWTSYSVRTPHEQDVKFDYEIRFGMEEKHTLLEYLWEREDGDYYKGSEMGWKYEGFNFTYFLREANEIEYTEAAWSKQSFIPGLKLGGAIVNDMEEADTFYTGFAKLKYKNLKGDLKHNGVDYYKYKIQFKGYSHKGFYPLFIFKDINGKKWYQAKIVYRFKLWEE